MVYGQENNNYVSITILEKLEKNGIKCIRNGIIKSTNNSELGYWNSKACKKIKIKEGSYGKD